MGLLRFAQGTDGVLGLAGQSDQHLDGGPGPDHLQGGSGRRITGIYLLMKIKDSSSLSPRWRTVGQAIRYLRLMIKVD